MIAAEPRLLRCPDYGLVIEAKIGRVWSQVIARDAREVYVKRIPNAFIQKYAKVVDYPKGIAEAAFRFLNPALGIAQVTPAAQNLLEVIMQTYTTKSSAVRGLGRISLGLLARRDEFIKKDGENFTLDDDAARAAVGASPSVVRVDARSPLPTAEQVAAQTDSLDKRPRTKIKTEKTPAEKRQAAMKKGGAPAKKAQPKGETAKPAAPRKPKEQSGTGVSRKTQARIIFANCGGDSKLARPLIEALGIAASSAASWCSEFRRAAA